jgi:hypothetical protein
VGYLSKCSYIDNYGVVIITGPAKSGISRKACIEAMKQRFDEEVDKI